MSELRINITDVLQKADINQNDFRAMDITRTELIREMMTLARAHP
jgi:hypothetical protein